MGATVASGRPTVLVIHGDGDTLDLMTRLFEAAGCDVVAAVTGFRAQAHLEGDRPVDVVVAPWDTANAVGGDVYRWALQKRYDLRDQFVFIASEVPGDFDRIVAGRCLAVSMVRPAEIVRVALAAVKRRGALEAAGEAAIPELDTDKPTLLLAEDEPVLLAVMADLLADSGYTVVRAESGRSAIAHLEQEDFDAIIVDWYMDDGTGADVYRWLREFKQWLASRVVFLSGEEGDDAAGIALGRPMHRKGMDSATLIDVLSEIIRDARREPDTERP
jgi:CheY-like chemotaxis protein